MHLFILCALLMASVDVARSRYVDQSLSDDCRTKGLDPHKMIATWEEAAEQCRAEGAVLASPITLELLQRMTSIIGINHHQTPFYIGLKATSHLGPFVSLEGISLDEMPSEVSDMVDALDQLLGDCLIMDHTSIRVTSCLTRLPYMCYNNETKYACEDNVEEYKMNSETGSYYKLHSEHKMWDEAHLTCVEEGGYLAVPNDEKEAKIIFDMYFDNDMSHGTFSESDFMWIGVRDRLGNGNWMSVNGEPIQNIYHIWDSFNTPPAHDFKCAGFYGSGGEKISMRPCDYSKSFYHKAAFVCEKNI